MTIKFLGQNGFILTTKQSKIIIDPYLSNSVYKKAGRNRLLPIVINPKNINCDAVICTHNHLDHLDPDTIKEISSRLFITTESGKEEIEKLGKKNVKALKPNSSITVGDITITAVFAKHTTEAFGLIIKAEEKTLYFSGDTLFSEKLFDIKNFNPNITFICINGKLGNMNVTEALTVAKKIGAKINIPCHYDMFESNKEDPHAFADNIDGGKILLFNKSYTF